jgi:uncharacterized membrane protein YfcA
MTKFVIGVFGLALLVIGLHFMWSGRNEFGDEHRRFATIGCWLIPIGILVQLLGGVFGGAAAATVGFLAGFVVASIVTGISVFLSTLALVFMVYHLENLVGKIFLVVGFCMIIGIFVSAVVAPGASALLLALPLVYVVLTILAYIIALGRVIGGASS